MAIVNAARGLKMEGRAAEPAIERRSVDSRRDQHRSAGALLNDRRPDRTHREARGAEPQRADLERIEADHHAGATENEAAAAADVAGDRQPQRLHAATGEAPVELGHGADRCRAARPGTELDG